MSRPKSKTPSADALPVNGSNVALLTKSGILGGVLTGWSDKGAVIEASGAVVAGEHVRLRVQGPDKIWEKKANVLWVKGRDIALEFELGKPESVSSIGRIIQRAFAAMRRPAHSSALRGASKQKAKPRDSQNDKRRRARIRLE